MVSWWREVTGKLCWTGTCKCPTFWICHSRWSSQSQSRLEDVWSNEVTPFELVEVKSSLKILSVRCYASRSRTMQVWGIHTGITCRFRASWQLLYQNGVTVTVCAVAACFIVNFLVFSLAVRNQRQLTPPTGPKCLFFSGEPTEPTKCVLQIRETPIHIQTTRTSPMCLLSRQPV